MSLEILLLLSSLSVSNKLCALKSLTWYQMQANMKHEFALFKHSMGVIFIYYVYDDYLLSIAFKLVNLPFFSSKKDFVSKFNFIKSWIAYGLLIHKTGDLCPRAYTRETNPGNQHGTYPEYWSYPELYLGPTKFREDPSQGPS